MELLQPTVLTVQYTDPGGARIAIYSLWVFLTPSAPLDSQQPDVHLRSVPDRTGTLASLGDPATLL